MYYLRALVSSPRTAFIKTRGATVWIADALYLLYLSTYRWTKASEVRRKVYNTLKCLTAVAVIFLEQCLLILEG